MTLERYSHVMHLTSQVAGELADGRNAVDVLRATFPAGTVSGAPKVRAMEIIDALEPVKRGPYAGVVGYLDFSGQPRHGDHDPHDGLAGRPRERVGRRRDRRRLGSGRRGPRVPQQGTRAAHRRGRGPAAQLAHHGRPVSTRCAERPRHGVVRRVGPGCNVVPPEPRVTGARPVSTAGEGVRSLLLTPQGKLDVVAAACVARRRTTLVARLRHRLRRTARRVAGSLPDPGRCRDRGSQRHLRPAGGPWTRGGAARCRVRRTSTFPTPRNSHVEWGDRRDRPGRLADDGGCRRARPG